MRSFNRNLKAISPIFATLILIAIAVIAGVVVYMFTSGTLSQMTGSGTAGQEKVAIQSVAYPGGATGTLTLQVQTISGNPTFANIIVKDASTGNTVSTVAASTGTAVGSLTPVTGAITGLTVGHTYTATLVTAAGGSFVSNSFTA